MTPADIAAITPEQAPAPRAQVEAAVRARLLAGDIELPLLPQVASQVLSLAADPRSDAARLSALVHRDQALAGQVLRMANSVAYASRMPIVSLQQAVARLGMGTVSEIAFSASVQKDVFAVHGHEALLRDLWRHALASATLAKEIARGRRDNIESAYLCGLLHGVGKPLVLQLAVNAADKLQLRLPNEEMEALLGALHVHVGALLGQSWKLSRPVLCAILHHADPLRAPAFRAEASVTALASALASHGLSRTPRLPGGPEELALRALPVIAELNLYPDDLDKLIGELAKVVELVNSLTL